MGQRNDELLQVTNHNDRIVAAVAADVWGCDNDQVLRVGSEGPLYRKLPANMIANVTLGHDCSRHDLK